MITPNILTNVGNLVIWKGTVQNGPTDNTGVQVDFTIPSDFSVVSANLEGVGTLDAATGIWTVGDLTKGATICFEIVLKLDAATQGFDFDYDFVATVSGIDTLQDNNTLEDVVNYKVETCDPMGASNDSTSGCLCVDVSQYGTPCSEGTTEYRLNVQSIVNGTNTSWNNLTGLGDFIAIDPTLPITFTYDTYCVQGAQEYQVSCDTQHTITPQLVDKDIYDHTIESVDFADFTAADIKVLQTQYPDLVIADYCWHVIKNADGDVTSGLPLDCDETRDTRTEFSCSDVEYTDGMTIEETSFEDPEKGDNLIVAFTNGTGYFNYVPSADCTSGTWEICSFVPTGITEVNWTDIQGIPAGFADGVDNEGQPTVTIDWGNITNKPAGFADDIDNDTISPAQAPTFQSIAVTGTTTKTITVTLTDGSIITADFTDLQGSGGAGTVDWADITGVPAGFADGVDNDTISSPHPELTINLDGNTLQLLEDGTVVDTVALPTVSPQSSLTSTYRGQVDDPGRIATTSDLFFPKVASQASDLLREIVVYGVGVGSSANSGIKVEILDIGGTVIDQFGYDSSLGVFQYTFATPHLSADGYILRLVDSPTTPTTTVDSTISATLYYA